MIPAGHVNISPCGFCLVLEPAAIIGITCRIERNLHSGMCNLHEKYIQTIERDHRNISISVFVKIAKALDISPSNLLEKALGKS